MINVVNKDNTVKTTTIKRTVVDVIQELAIAAPYKQI